MKFDRMVKYNGIYYPTGADVPVEETPVVQKKEEPIVEQTEVDNPLDLPIKYTKNEINRLSTAKLRAIALENGIFDADNRTGQDLKKVLIGLMKL